LIYSTKDVTCPVCFEQEQAMQKKPVIVRAILISLLIIFLAPSTWAQDGAPEIFTIVENMPKFPGCEIGADERANDECSRRKLVQYLADNVKYPKEAREAGIDGLVYVKFTVTSEGKIRDAKVLKGIGGGCDKEALRVVNGMPDWIPGTQRGRPVAVFQNLPVRYSLTVKALIEGESDIIEKKDTPQKYTGVSTEEAKPKKRKKRKKDK